MDELIEKEITEIKELCKRLNIPEYCEGLSTKDFVIIAFAKFGDYLYNNHLAIYSDIHNGEFDEQKDWIEKNLDNLENQESEEFAELVEEYEILFNGADLMEDLELYYA